MFSSLLVQISYDTNSNLPAGKSPSNEYVLFTGFYIEFQIEIAERVTDYHSFTSTDMDYSKRTCKKETEESVTEDNEDNNGGAAY